MADDHLLTPAQAMEAEGSLEVPADALIRPLYPTKRKDWRGSQVWPPEHLDHPTKLHPPPDKPPPAGCEQIMDKLVAKGRISMNDTFDDAVEDLYNRDKQLLPRERIAIKAKKAADLEARRLRGMRGRELARKARGMQIAENKRNYRARKKMLADMQESYNAYKDAEMRLNDDTGE